MSMRDTVPSPAFATQTAPAPTATAVGASPTRTGSGAGADRDRTVRRPQRFPGDVDRLRHLTKLGVDCSELSERAVGDPDRARPDSDARRRPIVERIRACRSAPFRVDLRQRALVEVPDPDHPAADSDRAGP